MSEASVATPTTTWQRVAFDIETDGMLDTVTKLHSLVIVDLDTKEMLSASSANGLIPRALEILMNAVLVVGHNILGYDLRALRKLYESFKLRDGCVVRDTMIMGMLMVPDIIGPDFEGPKRITEELKSVGELGSYSLRAWGIRLGFRKTDFEPAPEEGEDVPADKWAHWSPEMQRYCENDVLVTVKLWEHLSSMGWPEQPIDLVHEASEVCYWITHYGFPFDVEAARDLYLRLTARLEEVSRPLRERFGLIVERKKEKVWKVTRGHMVKGAAFTEIKIVPFNPGSRIHIVKGLKKVYGIEWKHWTPDSVRKAKKAKDRGEADYRKHLYPQVDESVLKGIDVPERDALLECFMLSKRLGQLATGQQAWLKKERNGRIHCRYKVGGAVTGRATHSSPNIAQVPAVEKGKGPDGTEVPLYGTEGGWGWECRSLFRAPKGWKQVGADQSGLELRCLAHYLWRFGEDGGRYARLVSDPNVDIHEVNAKAWSDAKITIARKPGKTLTYATLYGAGDAHIGELLNPAWDTETRRREGAKRRRIFYRQTPGLDRLMERIEEAIARKGWLRGLDGRRLRVRSSHAALNTLLQSAGAIICANWLVLAWKECLARGLKPGWDGDFVFVAWVHDEIQVMCREGLEHVIGPILVECAKRAGERFGFLCPLASNYVVGNSWAETH